MGASRPSLTAQTSYTSESPLNISLEGWSPGRFGTMSPGDEDPYGMSSLVLLYDDVLPDNVSTY